MIEKLEKDVEEKDRLIKSLMTMLRDERSKTKEPEKKKQICSSEEESSLKVRQPKDTQAADSENAGNRNNSQDDGVSQTPGCL